MNLTAKAWTCVCGRTLWDDGPHQCPNCGRRVVQPPPIVVEYAAREWVLKAKELVAKGKK